MKNSKAGSSPDVVPATMAKTDAAAPAPKIKTVVAAPAAVTESKTEVVKASLKAPDKPRETVMTRNKSETGKEAVTETPTVPRDEERRSVPLYADTRHLNHESAEAIFEAASVVAKSYETFGSEWTRYARTSFDEGVAVFKALLGCATVEEAVGIQSNFVKSSVDRYLDESVRLSEITVAMTNQVLAPLNDRLNESLQAPNR